VESMDRTEDMAEFSKAVSLRIVVVEAIYAQY